MRVTPIAALTAALLMGGTLLLADHPANHITMDLYGAGPCAAPGYGTQTLQPGCSQCESNCCDDVWAGYCQQKHHGFCLPCIRPMPQRWSTMDATSCSDGCGATNASLPRNYPIPEPAPTPAPDPSAKPKAQPTHAPQLPPVPPAPPASQQLEKPKSSSPSDTTTKPFPMFNPAAWKIGAPAR